MGYSARLAPKGGLMKNAFYAQSGGVTAVINASACGVIETAHKHRGRIGKVYAGRHGIIGALTEDMIDTSKESRAAIRALRHTPGGAFGSARYKLAGIDKNRAQYERLIDIFRAHDIGYFFYNGGNDSMDTAQKVSEIAVQMDYPICCIGIPKTVDNDLPITDCCPGFGSAAKYIAVSTREAALDVASMARTSTKVFVLEVMGRHAGWMAAAGGLAGERAGDAPHIILFPEIAFDRERFLAKVKASVEKYGYCVVVVSEGVRDVDGKFLAEAGTKDAFGHAQLGGVGPVVAQMTRKPSATSSIGPSPTICSARRATSPRRWTWTRPTPSARRRSSSRCAAECRDAHHRAQIGASPTAGASAKRRFGKIANQEKKVPRNFITADGFGITAACRAISCRSSAAKITRPTATACPSM
jgi:6-phosphofructokinase